MTDAPTRNRFMPPPPSPVELTLDPQRLSFSLMKARLSYRLTLRNTGEMPIISLRVHSDLISAHASQGDDEHLLGPDMAEAKLQKIAQLDPDESVELKGEVDLLVAEVKVINHGDKMLLLPLIRFRLIGAGTPPLICAYVLGQPSPEGERVRPFRLDNGPSAHKEIIAHLLD